MNTEPSQFLSRVRCCVPLVHHITNYVTVNDCANICICAGGSPVMTDAREDVPAMVSMAAATVLNIGTLNDRTVESMCLAAETARGSGIPIVLDPVGAGATQYRTDTAERLVSYGPAVIKGNAGEIGVLSGLGGTVEGVDSVASGDAAESVRTLARRTGSIVAATGEMDYVSDGEVVVMLSNGTGLQGRVSGTGCMLSSVVGCYVGACGPSVESVAAAITAFNVAAELASIRGSGPGSFRMALFDELESLDADTLDDRAVWEVLRRASEHLERARHTVYVGGRRRAYPDTGVRPGLDLGAPGVGDHAGVQPAALGLGHVADHLVPVLDLEDHLLLAPVHPGVEGPPVLLLRPQGALDGGVADLGRDLPLAHVEVGPDEDHQLVLLGGYAESESHAAQSTFPINRLSDSVRLTPVR